MLASLIEMKLLSKTIEQKRKTTFANIDQPASIDDRQDDTMAIKDKAQNKDMNDIEKGKRVAEHAL
jgi:hypothetical protein